MFNIKGHVIKMHDQDSKGGYTLHGNSENAELEKKHV